MMDVKDFLGESNALGIDIWEKKYRFKDESFEDFLERITNGNKEVKELVKDKKFIYAGRILANRGLQKHGIKVTYSNCFTPEVKVLTKLGYKQINEIEVGDEVLTIDGTYQPVNAILINEYDGDLVVVDIKGHDDLIKATPNHKFYTDEGWVEIGNILDIKARANKVKAPHLISPTSLITTSSVEIDLLDYLKPNWIDARRRIVDQNNTLHTEVDCIGGNGAKMCRKASYIKRFISIDDDVMYLLGRYLGDGSLSYRDDTPSIFQIVFNDKNERHAYDRIKKILEDKFGVVVTDNSNKNQGTFVLKVNNILFGQFILQMVGRTIDKHLPHEYFGDINVLLGLIDSDGTVSNGRIKLVMRSYEFLEEVQEWLHANNIITRLRRICQPLNDKLFEAGEMNISKLQSNKILHLLTKSYADERLDSYVNEVNISNYSTYCEKYVGKVYNLSVENNHNYVVNGVLVHNCYVITPAEDNLESIYETDYKLARTFSYGGGCGTDVSRLAPAGARVNNAAKSTSGVVSFMEQFAHTTARIAQHGRRGALMLSIDSNHPDLEEFIKVKGDLNKIVSANISIRIDDDFMDKVSKGLKHTLRFERKETGEVIEREVNASKLFMKLAKMNWRTAEPGILFWDRIKEHTLLQNHPNFEFAGVNPCGR